MKISVVIPTYNGAEYIEEAICSILVQTRKPYEIIISDDNSTDKTIEICQKYKNNIKLFQNKTGPSGFVNGWNNAIDKAAGDYIAILHQDDKFESTFIENIEKVITKYVNVKHFFVPCKYINEESKIIYNPDYCDGEEHLYIGNEYVSAYQNIGRPHIHRCPGVVTHKDIFKKCKYRTEAGHIADDDFFYRVGQFTNVVGLLKPLAYYRIHSKSETGHIDNFELIKRLSNDYIFQIKEWSKSNFLNKQQFSYFVHWAKHYTFNLLYYSIKYKNYSTLKDAYKKIDYLKSININFSFKYRIYILLNRILNAKNII